MPMFMNISVLKLFDYSPLTSSLLASLEQSIATEKPLYGLQKCYKANGLLKDRRRTDRSRVTTMKPYDYMTVTYRRHAFRMATHTANELGISRQTILRRLPVGPRPLPCTLYFWLYFFSLLWFSFLGTLYFGVAWRPQCTCSVKNYLWVI